MKLDPSKFPIWNTTTFVKIIRGSFSKTQTIAF